METTKQYYRVREVCEILNIPSHTLRYWEKNFTQLNPGRTTNGQRRYSQSDLDLLKHIAHLLHEKRMSIEGVQKLLNATYRKQPVRFEHVCNTPKDALRLLCDVKKVLTDPHNIDRVESLEKWVKSL